MTENQKFSLEDNFGVIDSYECPDFIIRCARSGEREMVKEFVCRIHLAGSAYDEESRRHQIEDLPTDFPGLFNEDDWQRNKSWLCFDEREILLGCVGITMHTDELYTAEVSYFFVEEYARGRGIGRKLLKHAISWTSVVSEMNNRAITSIVLLTLRKYYEIAISLYQSEGFVIYEEKQVEFYTLVLMRLQLFECTNVTSLVY